MKTITLLMALAPAICYAQQGTGNGGGGEQLFHSITTETKGWLKRNLELGELDAKLHLRESNIQGDALVKAYEDAVAKTARIKFIPQSQLTKECVGGDQAACILEKTARICWNNSDPAYIECNEDRFLAAEGDLQFGIAFHEYLGVAKIETNIETFDEVNGKNSYSRYPISQYLIGFARPKASVRYELGQSEKNVAPNRCESGTGDSRLCGAMIKELMEKNQRNTDGTPRNGELRTPVKMACYRASGSGTSIFLLPTSYRITTVESVRRASVQGQISETWRQVAEFPFHTYDQMFELMTEANFDSIASEDIHFKSHPYWDFYGRITRTLFPGKVFAIFSLIVIRTDGVNRLVGHLHQVNGYVSWDDYCIQEE